MGCDMSDIECSSPMGDHTDRRSIALDFAAEGGAASMYLTASDRPWAVSSSASLMTSCCRAICRDSTPANLAPIASARLGDSFQAASAVEAHPLLGTGTAGARPPPLPAPPLAGCVQSLRRSISTSIRNASRSVRSLVTILMPSSLRYTSMSVNSAPNSLTATYDSMAISGAVSIHATGAANHESAAPTTSEYLDATKLSSPGLSSRMA